MKKLNIYNPKEDTWADEYWTTQTKMFWTPDQVTFSSDVKDWKTELNDVERGFLTNIFRFFVQADVEVRDGYNNLFIPYFSDKNSVLQMLSCFSFFETIHVKAYAKVLDTLGFGEGDYKTFTQYEVMVNKFNMTAKCHTEDPFSVARTIATFGAFTEGLQLYASFAMLLNFTRFGKMRSMGQIVSWSNKDEALHSEAMIRLYHQHVAGHRKDIDLPLLKDKITKTCKQVVEMEKQFIDLAFSAGGIEGLSKEEMYGYVEYLANMRLLQLECPTIYNQIKNPIGSWLNPILSGSSKANFFETKPDEYAKSSTEGEWDDVEF